MSRASLAELIGELPEHAPFYNADVGIVTLAQIIESRAQPEETPALADPLEPTLAMWEYIVLHPRCTREEWLALKSSGRIRPENEGAQE